MFEWAAKVAIGGAMGSALWDAIRHFAPRLRDWLTNDRRSGGRVYVSRGAAAVLAIQHVLDSTSETGILDVEAVEEPTAIAGVNAHELSYTGIEPWIVLLLSEDRERRYIVAVAHDGQLPGMLDLVLSEAERLYLPYPPPERGRPGGR